MQFESTKQYLWLVNNKPSWMLWRKLVDQTLKTLATGFTFTKSPLYQGIGSPAAAIQLLKVIQRKNTSSSDLLSSHSWLYIFWVGTADRNWFSPVGSQCCSQNFPASKNFPLHILFNYFFLVFYKWCLAEKLAIFGNLWRFWNSWTFLEFDLNYWKWIEITGRRLKLLEKD